MKEYKINCTWRSACVVSGPLIVMCPSAAWRHLDRQRFLGNLLGHLSALRVSICTDYIVQLTSFSIFSVLSFGLAPEPEYAASEWAISSV